MPKKSTSKATRVGVRDKLGAFLKWQRDKTRAFTGIEEANKAANTRRKKFKAGRIRRGQRSSGAKKGSGK